MPGLLPFRSRYKQCDIHVVHCHDRNKVNIISDPKKTIETLHVLQKLGKSVVPYICIWFITNGKVGH